MSSRFDDHLDSIPGPFCERLYERNDNDSEWRVIDEFPDYCVSKYGEVASIRTGKIRILSTWTNQYGHEYVELHNGYYSKKMLVHRLVATHFIPNPFGYPLVRHLDDDPSNNRVDNLEWGSSLDNRNDCIAHDRDYKKPVYCFELDMVFRSCAEAADFFDVSRSLITSCCSGRIRSIKNGHHLCYLSDKDDKMNDVDRWTYRSGNHKRVLAKNIHTGEELVFRSRSEASDKLGIPDSYISNIISGRSRYTRGWTFVDLEGKYE